MSFQANNFATQPCQRKMKKLIYLFLLLPFVSFSQLSGVQATTVFGGSATSGTNRAALAIGEVFTGATINIDRATLGIVSFADNKMITSFPEESFIQFKTFPNPAISTFQIDSPIKLIQILLFDANGKMVMKVSGTDTRVNVEALKSGFYQLFVVAETDKLYSLGGLVIAQ